jgi:hypothetical protein
MPCKRSLCKYRTYKRNWIDSKIPVCDHPDRHTLTWTPWARLWRLIFGQDNTCYAYGEADCRLYERFVPAAPPEQSAKEKHQQL